jgi:hypothetical protein
MSTVAELDARIAAAERRIAVHREQLVSDMQSLRAAARKQLTTPSALLFAVGIGFTIGRIVQRPGLPGQSRLARIWATLSESVKAAAGILQTPTVLWLVRLFSGQRSTAASSEMSPQTGSLGP